MNFASDNTAPVAPPIFDAMVRANAGYAVGYGNDDWTFGVERHRHTEVIVAGRVVNDCGSVLAATVIAACTSCAAESMLRSRSN